MDIIAHFTDLRYLPSSRFAYDASEDVINYVPAELLNDQGRLALLHETSHALLGHFHYSSDIELFFMEIDAWHKTAELTAFFDLKIDPHYITDCLDSYDSWLTERATCPRCSNFCLPRRQGIYQCFLCGCQWRVNDSKHDRVVRTIIKAPAR